MGVGFTPDEIRAMSLIELEERWSIYRIQEEAKVEAEQKQWSQVTQTR